MKIEAKKIKIKANITDFANIKWLRNRGAFLFFKRQKSGWRQAAVPRPQLRGVPGERASASYRSYTTYKSYRSYTTYPSNISD